MLFLKKILWIILIGMLPLSMSIHSKVSAQALPACNNPVAQTSPSPLYSDSTEATFIIDVENNQPNDLDPDSWQMEFQCGVRVGAGQIGPSTRMEKVKAAAIQNTENNLIQATLKKNPGLVLGGRCEFDPSNNPVQIKVKANVKGVEKDICIANYKVTPASAKCELKLVDSAGVPLTQITRNTDIYVQGANIPSPENFLVSSGLFLDDNGTAINPDLPSPDFKEVLTTKQTNQGQHTLFVKKTNFAPLGRIPGNQNYRAETTYCSLSFSIGTPENPGRPRSIATGSATKYTCKGSCTTAGGSICDPKDGSVPSPDLQPPAANYSGVMTAIGCVPTEPGAFVNALLRVVTAALGGIAFLFMIFGVFQFITSAGNPDGIKKGWGLITNAIIALLFIIFAVLLLKIIGVDLLNIPGFK